MILITVDPCMISYVILEERGMSCYMLHYVTVLTGCPCGPMLAGHTKVALSTGRQVRVDPARLYDVM